MEHDPREGCAEMDGTEEAEEEGNEAEGEEERRDGGGGGWRALALQMESQDPGWETI